jgi:hypothetical protein
VHRIFAGTPDPQPPPPLAGGLAAFLARRGDAVEILGRPPPAGRGSGTGPLWIHIEDEDSLSRALALVAQGGGLPAGATTLFGSVHRLNTAPPPDTDVVAGCAIDHLGGRSQDLDALPITTWAGFGPCGPAFRLLAGRGDDRVRSVRHVLREVVYLVETWKAGHLMFDDEDLGRYSGWADTFAAELEHLPWRLTWEATIGGRRHHRPYSRE